MDIDQDTFIYDGADELLSCLSPELLPPSVLEEDAPPSEILAQAALHHYLLSDSSHNSDDDSKSYQNGSGLQMSSSPSSSSSEGLSELGQAGLEDIKFGGACDWDNLYWDLGMQRNGYHMEEPPATVPQQMFSVTLGQQQGGRAFVKQELKMEPSSPGRATPPSDLKTCSSLPQFKLERESSCGRDIADSSRQLTSSPYPSPTSDPYQLLNFLNGTVKNGRILLTNMSAKVLPDTPPISPPSNLSPPASPPNVGNQNMFKIDNGGTTLCALQGMKNGGSGLPSLRLQNGGVVKKLKIQPKPYTKQPVVQNVSSNVDASKKTILLSAQDFAALSKKMTRTNSPPKTRIVTQSQSASNVQNGGTRLMDSSIQIIPISESPAPGAEPAPILMVNGNSPIQQVIPAPITLKKRESLQPIAASGTLENDPPPCPPLVRGNMPPEMALKALKKHQRMIKNRESACLSRKKKKEYVTMLESKLAVAETEIARLHKENAALRARLGTPTQQHQQQLTNRSVDRSQSNGTAKLAIPVIKAAAGLIGGSLHKKNAALLFAMMFMVSLNIGGFGTYWLRGETAGLSSRLVPAPRHTRALLWSPDAQQEDSYSDSSGEEDYVISNTSSKLVCPPVPPAVNSSESARLASELERWLNGEAAYANLSIQTPNLEMLGGTGAAANGASETETAAKHIERIYEPKDRPLSADREKQSGESRKEEPSSQEQKRVQGGLQASVRRADTYYLVALGGSRFLLPPTTHNHTQPPKVALLLPHPHYNESMSEEYVTLLQVDCAVLDTTFLRLRADSIPDYIMNGEFSFQSKSSNTTEEKSKDINMFPINKGVTKKAFNNVAPPLLDSNSGIFGTNSIDGSPVPNSRWRRMARFPEKLHPSIVNIKRVNNFTRPQPKNQQSIEKVNYNVSVSKSDIASAKNDFSFFYKNFNKDEQMLDKSDFANFPKYTRKWRRGGNVSYEGVRKSQETNQSSVSLGEKDVLTNSSGKRRRLLNPGQK